jgi:hypothetical protein
MFIVTTIACVWLAVVATRARKQKEAMDKIQMLRGVLHFDYQIDERQGYLANAEPEAPAWLLRTLGEDYFRRVVTVDFNFGGGNKATDANLAVFRNLPDVTTIELNNNPRVTDDGLEHLAGLSKLRVLYLYRANVKGPGIRHLPRNLQVLMLRHSPLTDEGLASLKNMPRLSTLRIGFTNVTDRGLAHLSELSALEDLELRNTDVTDAGLEHLRTLKNLSVLSLDHTKVTGAGVARLQQALPNCQILPSQQWLDARPQDFELWADGYQPGTDELLTKIKELGGSMDVKIDKTRPGQPVVSFMLFDSMVSDETLIQLLAQMPELEELNLRRVLVGDRVAKELPRLSKLRFLSLDSSRIIHQVATLHSSVADACRKFGVSRKTGYKWLGRYRAAPDHPLTDQSRRPKHSPGRTGGDLEGRILDVRREFGWGPRKIRASANARPGGSQRPHSRQHLAALWVHRATHRAAGQRARLRAQRAPRAVAVRPQGTARSGPPEGSSPDGARATTPGS